MKPPAATWPLASGEAFGGAGSPRRAIESGLSAKSFTKCFVPILAVTILALLLRLPRLEQRPMHGDEAIHAIKFGQLLEQGIYVYDPNEYHGPTLNYLTLIPAWLSSAEKLTEVSERTLRIVPVFFGVLLVLLLLLIVDGLGLRATICAAILTAISPAFVFYSRYYIQEMPLVCFTFGVITCGWRYAQSKKIGWALLTGMFLALMHATKETCIISFGSMFLALLIVLLLQRGKEGHSGKVKTSHIIAGLAVAVAVSALLYSSFLTNPKGILDSVRTYTVYFSRAGHNNLHIHPWYYYLKMLLCSEYDNGPVWSEGFIVLLAAIGFIVAIRGKDLPNVNVHLLRFIAFYTVIMTILYSAIPYKTPWSMLGFLHGMILLAGVGAVVLVRLMPNVLPRLIVICLLIIGSLHLTWQVYLGSYKYYADNRNPYVYAHPTTDVLTMVRSVQETAGVHEDGFNMHIQVICPENDYWPFPWYLRSFNKVYWRAEVTDEVVEAAVIIASANLEQEIIRKLYELPPPGKKNLYVPLFDTYMELRPQVELRGYVRKGLWDRFQQSQAQPFQSQPSR